MAAASAAVFLCSAFAEAGLLFNFADGEVEYDGAFGGFDYDAFRFAGFLGFEFGNTSILAAGTYSSDDYENIRRNTNVAGQVAVGETSGKTVSGLVEVRHDIAFNPAANFTPVVRIRGASVNIDGYTEAGAVGLNQIVGAREFEPAAAEFGADLNGRSGRMSWSLEGVLVDPLKSDGQIVETSLVTIPTVGRTVITEGRDAAYGRAIATFGFDLTNTISLEAGGGGVFGRDEGEIWTAFGRITGRW